MLTDLCMKMSSIVTIATTATTVRKLPEYIAFWLI